MIVGLNMSCLNISGSNISYSIIFVLSVISGNLIGLFFGYVIVEVMMLVVGRN